MLKNLQHPFKKNKLKTFLFFLFLAMIYWLLTKFSKDYTAVVNANVTYEQIPINTLLAEDTPENLPFEITANGFEIIYYKLKNPAVTFPLSPYYKDTTAMVRISGDEVSRILTSQLNNTSVKNLFNGALVVQLDKIISKKVPVIPAIKIKYKEAYASLDSLVVVPDSVMVSGPSQMLKEINAVETAFTSLENVSSNVVRQVPLIAPPSAKIAVNPTSVKIALEVNEFTQKKIQLPVTIENLPEGVTIKLIPELVTVSFNVSVADFTTISEEDFKVVCKYTERNKVENFMIPTLVKKPENVINIELNVKKIDYLVFK